MTDHVTHAVADLLPEYSEYRDEGCDLFSSCLDCPLPRCRYDEKVGRERIKQRLRDARIVAQHKQGMSVADLARTFRVSKRTVQRVVKGEGRGVQLNAPTTREQG